MNKSNKMLIGLIIGAIFFATAAVVGANIILKNKDKNNTNNEVKKPETMGQTCPIKMDYVIDENFGLYKDIALTKNEEENLYNILNSLEYSDVLDSVVIPRYEINFCEKTLSIGDNEIVSYNKDVVSITKGYEDLKNYINTLESGINRVYFYKLNEDGENSNMEEIILTSEEKNIIKNAWNNQTKEPMIVNLMIIMKYALYIDGELIGLDENLNQTRLNGGIVTIDPAITNILQKQIGN